MLGTRQIGVVAVYAVLLAVLLADGLQHMVARWGTEDYNYGYLIPFVVLYLVWERQRELLGRPNEPSWVGLLPLFVGLGLFWLGELGGEFFSLYLAFWFLLVGILWLHLGYRKLKVLAFPLLLVLTAFPLPNFLHNKVTLKMKLLASQLGVALLQGWGYSAYREGNVIDLGFTQLQVVDACSGLRYVFPLLVLALLLAYGMKRALWKRALLVFSAIPISILTNALRVAVTGVLAEHWGPEAAQGFFHDFTGWFVFMASLAILLPEMWLLAKLPDRRRRSGGRTLPSMCRPERTWRRVSSVPHFVTAVVLIGVSALAAQTVEFREKIPLRQPLSSVPLHLGGWQGEPSTLEADFIEALDFSDYLLADYRNADGRVVNFYVAYYESQRKGESIHSPETCLPGGGWIFREAGTADLDVPGRSGESIRVNRALVEKLGQEQLSYFWFPQRGRVLRNAYELKLYAFWDALTRQRTDGALVRLVTPVYRTEDVAAAEARLADFARLAVPELARVLPD